MIYKGYELVHKAGHVEVLKDGDFQFSADNESEAMLEIDKEAGE